MSNTSSGAQASFGTCWSCVSDVTMPAVMVSGNTCVAEALLRRFTTPRGRLIDDPNYGLDIPSYIGTAQTSASLSKLARQANAEAAKDERVLRADLVISLALGVLRISGIVYTANGPFQLVAEVSSITVALLQVSPA